MELAHYDVHRGDELVGESEDAFAEAVKELSDELDAKAKALGVPVATLLGGKIRDKVPMYFVTPEPYIGHLGLDGVGDTKSMLESEMRERHIQWTTNAKITSVEDGKIHFIEVDDGAMQNMISGQDGKELGDCVLRLNEAHGRPRGGRGGI